MRKKLIEVALPLEAINKAAAREKSIRHGHPSTLHLWWARRPLAAARAVIFAQMVDDPSSRPELFPTEEAQEKERQRLFRLIEELVEWENTTNERVLEAARKEIRESWRRTCEDNKDHPRAKELFDPNKLPGFHDPFAGGGALPLEAQRLGLESFASDLNPVAVLINKAMIEIPPKFAGRAPVNPESRRDKKLISQNWRGAQGLAEDVRYYGQWMRTEAEKRIGHLYPKIEVTARMAEERPDLASLVGQTLTVIAWLWARTVRSPNPAFGHIDVPLAASFVLGTKPGKEAYVAPVVHADGYTFTVRTGEPEEPTVTRRGTKVGGSGSSFACLMSGSPMPFDYLRTEAKAGRMGARLMAIVAEGARGRVYLSPTSDLEERARCGDPEDVPDAELPKKALGFRLQEYGMTRWRHLFTNRQLVALTTFADLVRDAHNEVLRHQVDGSESTKAEYAEAVATYLALAVGRTADYSSTICTWASNPQMEIVRGTFARQALPMTWDFAEANLFGPSTGSFEILLGWVCKAILRLPSCGQGHALQHNAVEPFRLARDLVVSTDPPYYDNIGYADLSDFFYVWLRRAMKSTMPSVFATVAVPKAEELVATPFRHGSKQNAETFFIEGMGRAMRRLAIEAHPAFPVTIYYAFKQSETDDAEGSTTSTGWETFLDAVVRSGLAIGGTWPVRTERAGRSVGIGTNALASSIVLVCRQRADEAPTATRRDFLIALKAELPEALRLLQRGNIAPVDLAQAAIGPGMAVFTRYGKVLDAKGDPMRVREALALVNQTLDEVLAEQEGDFDADSRFALVWFDQHGFDEGEFGVADVLSRAKNTSVKGMEEAGILLQKGGKVRLFRPTELPANWDPTTDTRLTAWESVHHLVRALESGGEDSAANIARNLGSKAEPARELAYRLYSLCERKKRAAEALSYNALVQSWPEITRRAAEGRTPTATQQEFI